jgi:hypothetical protein
LENQVWIGDESNKMSTTKLDGSFVLCQSVPHLALRILLSPRWRIEGRANALNKLTVGQHFQTKSKKI